MRSELLGLARAGILVLSCYVVVHMTAEMMSMHAMLCQVLGVTVSHSLRRAAGEQLSPQDARLADLEDDAVAAALKFKRHYELSQS